MSQSSLFDAVASEARSRGAPLAERMRPRSLDEYAGQSDIIAPGRILRRIFDLEKRGREIAKNAPAGAPKESGNPLPSVIFWGPPGSGKTTLAHLLAKSANAHFEMFSAVSGGIKEAREAIAAARDRLTRMNRRTVLFVDEIHRFNRAQQDAFLPSVEEGTISLIGATTENPSFEVNSALLSRCRVFVLKQLTPTEIGTLLDRAVADKERGLGLQSVTLPEESREILAQYCGGDARTALNALELASLAAGEATTPDESAPLEKIITPELAREALQRNTILYDQSGEEHYNLISALHKSIRHSDPQAALYYLARMIAGGEDPMFIVRRLVKIATEDVGLADPHAAVQAAAAYQAVALLGYPECDTALAQLAVYMAVAPKSNAVYMAVKAAKAEVAESGPLPVPLHYRNAPTGLMKALDYGAGYQYDHDWPDKIAPQEAMPDALVGKIFYTPGALGFEKDIAKRIEYFEKVRQELRQK